MIPTSLWYYLYDSVHLPRSERIRVPMGTGTCPPPPPPKSVPRPRPIPVTGNGEPVPTRDTDIRGYPREKKRVNKQESFFLNAMDLDNAVAKLWTTLSLKVEELKMVTVDGGGGGGCDGESFAVGRDHGRSMVAGDARRECGNDATAYWLETR
ncbi:hypothetical protein PIB30_080959 [Stylosanthes scabra]|uniref:Uncharacterized protein n=1 Tax=Stylosanthes scabra TaxID=79078 RepID=A0ABU6ZQC9_9FABA|nr:hypothetical protein [Stylosanthes scabra]